MGIFHTVSHVQKVHIDGGKAHTHGGECTPELIHSDHHFASERSPTDGKVYVGSGGLYGCTRTVPDVQ